jgi:hypothetical protein
MRKPCPSDLTDEQGEIIQPLIPVNAVGRPRTVELREVLHAIFPLNLRVRPGTGAGSCRGSPSPRRRPSCASGGHRATGGHGRRRAG